MESYVPVLRSSAVFSGLDDAEIIGALSCLDAATRTFPKDDYLLRAGEAVSSFGLVLAGSVLVVQEDFWGNRNIVAAVGAGGTFGEVFACSPGAVPNVGVVAQSEVTAAFLDVRRILTACPSACEHHCRIIRNLVASLAKKNLALNAKVTHMGQRTTRAKLLSYLSAQAQAAGSARFDIPFSRQELADYLSVERSGLSQELGKMRREGLVDFDRNRFVLHAG